MTAAAFEALFQLGRIKDSVIPNRIVMPPMTTRAADAQGFVTPDMLAYYRARAQGGVGLITVEMAAPEKAGRHRHHELGIYDDVFLPGLTRLVDEIHRWGAKASVQLGHGGGHTRVDISGEQPIAPSAIPHPVQEITFETIIPEEMSKSRIRQTIEAFAKAAARAEKAGFDCVEIHGAHGYLISQFLTPFENRRTDEYGGSLENRARFGLEVLRAVKEATSHVAVIFRLSVDDYFPEGMPYEEGRQVALWVAQAGADALHIAAGHYRSLPSAARQMPPMAQDDATFLPYAADIRAQVNVPVIAVGRLGVPQIAADAIGSGKADFIALGRSLIADPEWPAKVRQGITPRLCLACNSCINEMRSGAKLGCVVNGAAGREHVLSQRAIPTDRKITVIGAGPAGLSYASLVADRNAVTVFERSDRPGGSFRYAGKAPMFETVEATPRSFERYINSVMLACERKGVQFRFNTNVLASPEVLAEFDDIVVAAGAAYRFGLEPIVKGALNLRVGRWPGLRTMLSNSAVRDWFYYRGRIPTGHRFERLKLPHQTMVFIGDAASAGKSRQAIRSAFDAAFSVEAPVLASSDSQPSQERHLA